MLARSEISKRIEAGDIVWNGDTRGNGLLLRLGAVLQPLVSATPSGIVDLSDQDSISRLYEPVIRDWDDFLLIPGRLVLCQADEPLQLGNDLAAVIGTLSHLARTGFGTHVDSPWVLPGWNGYLTLELHNRGPVPLRIQRAMPVARLLLINVEGRVTATSPHPFYGASGHLDSRYAEEFPVHEYRR